MLSDVVAGEVCTCCEEDHTTSGDEGLSNSELTMAAIFS